MMRAPGYDQDVVLTRVEIAASAPYFGRITVFADAAEREMRAAGIGGEEVAQTDEIVVCGYEEEDSGTFVFSGCGYCFVCAR